MKKYSLQEWLCKLALPGILIGLFTFAAFTPEINSLGTGINSRGEIFTAFNSQCVKTVFSTGVEYVNLSEPVNGHFSQTTSSITSVVPVAYASSAFHANNQYPGNYTEFSDKEITKSFREMYLLLDIPPPAVC
jgi:hypothetical protein